jgi:hypothetical protein
MKNNPGNLVILIGNESPAKIEAPWSDYFSIYIRMDSRKICQREFWGHC